MNKGIIFNLQMQDGTSKTVTKNENYQFSKEIEYIRQNIYEEITLDELAEKASLSKDRNYTK